MEMNTENDRIEDMANQLAKLGASEICITSVTDEDSIHSIRFNLNGVAMRAQANPCETKIYGIGINEFNGASDLARLIGGAK